MKTDKSTETILLVYDASNVVMMKNYIISNKLFQELFVETIIQ